MVCKHSHHSSNCKVNFFLYTYARVYRFIAKEKEKMLEFKAMSPDPATPSTQCLSYRHPVSPPHPRP